MTHNEKRLLLLIARGIRNLLLSSGGEDYYTLSKELERSIQAEDSADRTYPIRWGTDDHQ